MGGSESEIKDNTKVVLLESEFFQPENIRRTSKQLGLSTESSYRFERGADIGGVEFAMKRATDLIADMAGSTSIGKVIDIYPQPRQKISVSCRWEKANSLIGLDINQKK